MYRAAFAFVLVLGLAGSASAQNIEGTITGLVQDPSGAVVPGAKVTALNQETGVAYPAAATSAGVYVIPQVPMGRYTVTVEARGFRTFEQSGLELVAGAPLRVDVHLELGNATQTVTVSGAAPLVQTENATLGSDFTQSQFDALPIGRDPGGVLALLPGAESTTNFETGIFNGALQYTVDFKIDGTPATMTNLHSAPQAPPLEELVGEVVAQTSNYSSEYGRGSAQISINTISGTNQFHGTLFEYFQNEDLNANSFFNNLHNVARPLSRQNEFGGTLGGPIVVPHVYNGHDRTFFTFGYQKNLLKAPAQYTQTLPTAAQRSGNFTAAGVPAIYDPATTTQLANGSYTRTAFPGNTIPLARMDPVALKLLANAWPLPNLPGTANNYFISGISPTNSSQYQARLDENFSQRNRLTARLTRWYYDHTNLDPWPGPSGTPSTSTSQNVYYQYTIVSLEHTYTIRPNLVNVFRYGYFYDVWHQFGPGMFQNWAGQVGLINAGPQEFPLVSITGVASFGGGALLLQTPAGNHTFADTLLWVRGRHSVKFGFEYRHLKNHIYFPPANSGQFTFNTLATNNPATGAGGVGMASFLLGLPTSSTIGAYPDNGFNFRWPYYAAFVQDDFRVGKKLTLNLGLRWEVNMPFTEMNNQMSNFNLATQQLGLAGRNGYPTAVFDPFYKGFSPRFGFAYAPFGDNKTVIRGGYGIFFQPNAIGGSPFTFGPWNQSLGFPSPDNGITFPITLAGGFPLINPNAPLVLSANTSVQTTPRTYTPSYTQQWNFNLQRQIGGANMVQVGYVGNEGTHIPGTSVNLNQVPANLLGPGNAQLRRPYPNLGNITYGAGSVGLGTSSYNALQVLYVRRMSQGLSAQAAYSFAKTLSTFDFDGSSNAFGSLPAPQNNYNLAAERSPAVPNQTNILTWGFVWELPAGKNRHFLNRGGWMNAVVGGWQLSSISGLRSGLPLLMGTVQNLTGSLGGGSRPNRRGNASLPGSQRSIYEWFNPGMFVLPAAYTFGNDSRTEPQVDGPGNFNMDLLLGKQFYFTDRLRLEFRCQASNSINHFNPGTPNTSIGAPGVGTITGGSAGRSLLLSLRLHF